MPVQFDDNMFTSISPVYLFFAGDLLYESVEFKLRNLLVVFTTLASHFSLFKCSSLLCSGELKQLELVLCLCNFTYTLHTEKKRDCCVSFDQIFPPHKNFV